MSGPDISSQNSFNAQNASVGRIQPPTSISSSTPSNEAIYHSSLEPSHDRALTEKIAAELGIILLPLPGVSSISSTMEISIENTKNNIIGSMWVTYSAGLKEIANQVKIVNEQREIVKNEQQKIDKASAYLTEQIINAAKKQDEERHHMSVLETRVADAFTQWMQPDPSTTNIVSGTISQIPGISSDGGKATQKLANYPNDAFIVGSVVISLGQGFGPHMTTNPVADVLHAVGPASGLGADYQAAAAMIAALLYNGAIFKATFETLDEASKAKKPLYDLEFAKNYAKNIMAIVTAPIEKTDVTNPEIKKQNQLIRLMLTTMALNMVYRLAYGSMTGIEFEDLLKGNTHNLREDIKSVVIQLVTLIKSFLPENPKENKNTVANLKTYIEDKTSIENMLKTTRLFSGLLKNSSMVDGNRIHSTTN